MRKQNREWLDGLKAGDEVAVLGGYGRTYRLDPVVRVTDTQIVLPHDQRFRKEDGRRIGRHGFDASYIVPPTPEIVARVRHAALASRLQYTEWRKLPLATLEAVAAALDASPAPAGATPPVQ